MAALPWDATEVVKPLHEGEVHLWRTATRGAGGASDLALLSSGERSRASRLRRTEERQRWIAGRATVRRVLGAYLHEPPEALAFGYGPFGKPFLPEVNGVRCRFSVSHAGDLLLVAVTRDRDVGIDVERVREVRRWRRVAERHFAPDVQRVLESMEPIHGAAAFLHAWTSLEAHAKARGGGVYATRTHLPLPWPPTPEGELVPEQGEGAEDAPWTVRVLHPADGFVGTLAVQGAVTGWGFFEVPGIWPR